MYIYNIYVRAGKNLCIYEMYIRKRKSKIID